jgi:plastocyanin
MGPRIAGTVVAVIVAWGVSAWPGVAVAADHPVTFPTVAAPAQYAPNTVEAVPGDTVTLSGSFASHPLVWDAGDVATQSTGTTQVRTFDHAGTFLFHCSVHPMSMFGTVHVAAAAPAPDQFATPDFTWAPAAPRAGQPVAFAATGFADPDGSIAQYQWDLDGDGSYEASGAQITRTYGGAGTVSVALRYVDDRGQTSPATVHAVAVAAATGAGSTPPAAGDTGGSGTLPGGGTQGGGSTRPGSTAPGIRLTTRALTFRGGKATVSLSVSRTATATVTLRAGKSVLALGQARVRAGARHVGVKLTRAGARRLRRARTLRASLTAVLRGPRGNISTVHRTVTVRLAR